jgi:hypothetical protein
MPIQATSATGAACNPNSPTPDGPCAIQIRPYDAIAFASNPATAPVLPTDEVVINDCGQFRIKNIQPQGAQYIGIGIENNDNVATKTLRRTGVALPYAPKAIAGFPGYAVRISTDAHWSQTAGFGTGPTFVDRGVYMGIFLHGQTPVAGVKITRGGSTDPANDYYFSDTAPNMRFTIDPAQPATGVDGSGLMLGDNGDLTPYSGTGGETNMCKWPSDLGDQLTNIAFVQPRIEVQTANPTMICP